ncbi:premnaspirodiene oxygenase-like [Rhododendron vialii]|uniref:premnaspirodiene oxygenase-like n=1 Tax=Rhododendron vialii TaxID=182163 RepID=UPI00265D919C|nr:premnaspirodiene oxygenase-like [Rhododendron vialii]
MDLLFPFSITTLFLPLLFFLFNLLKTLTRSKIHNPTPKIPPGPWKLPLIGSIHHLAGSEPHRSLRNLAAKYGPLMHLQLGENSTVVISSPRLAKEVMQTQDVAFANRPPLLAVKSMTYNYVDIAFCPYGDYWRQMRKICILELLSTKNVRYFSSIREDEVFHLVESIKKSSGSSINLANKILSLTNDIIFRAAFGKRCDDQDVLMPLMKESIELAGGFNLCDLFPSFKVLHFLSGMRHKLVRLHEKMDQILENIIDGHEENLRSSEGGNGEAGEEDLLDVLLRLKHSGDLQFPMTNNNIKAIILEIFSAGTEASSNIVEWAMSEMVRNPRVMEKAQAELRQALQGKKRIRESDIQGLKYLKLVIKETLRLYPSALLVRECREQAEIDGFRIPVKTQVIVNAWAMGRDPEYWEDAEKFSPERFDNSPVDLLGNDFQYIPFGAGRRKCPGMTFGLANMELPLAQLLYHFNWELPGGTKPEDLDMRETFGATVRRISNLHLVATPHYFT